MAEGDLIEALYAAARGRGGQAAQLETEISTQAIAAGFRATVDDLSTVKASGPFYKPGSRKSLFGLSKAHTDATEILNTNHVYTLLGRPPRCQVAGDEGLDFEYAARELTPVSAQKGSGRVWLRPESARHLSLDALLVNADDRTPIVAEIKVNDDENAELALIQALAAAAQLSNPSQLRRLHSEYRDFFDAEKPPQRLDVYVITAGARTEGTRPALAKRAHAHARELMEGELLSRWIRRIAFIEMTLESGRPAFKKAT